MTRNRRLRLIDALLYSAAAAAAGSVRLIFPPLPSFLCCCCCCCRLSERFSAPGRIQSGTFLTFLDCARDSAHFFVCVCVCVYPPLSPSGEKTFLSLPFLRRRFPSAPLSPSPRPSRCVLGGEDGRKERGSYTHTYTHWSFSAGLCVDVGGEGTLVVPGLSRRPVLSLPLSSFLVKTALWPRPFALLCVLLCVCCVFLVTHENERKEKLREKQTSIER